MERYNNFEEKMVEVTELENKLIDIISEGMGDCDMGYPIPDIEMDGLNEQAIGGLISSLVKKKFAQILDAKEYSLGCNCIALYD